MLLVRAAAVSAVAYSSDESQGLSSVWRWAMIDPAANMTDVDTAEHLKYIRAVDKRSKRKNSTAVADRKHQCACGQVCVLMLHGSAESM